MHELCVWSIVEDSLGVKVVRSYMGRFMTSLEMAGVSLTLMKLDNQILPLLGNYSATCTSLMWTPLRRDHHFSEATF
jgi:dihydroxyacetone kinase